MALRKTFIIKNLPEKRPNVGLVLLNSIAENLYRNRNRHKRVAENYGETWVDNPLPYKKRHSLTWLSFIFRQVFKDTETEFCPIDYNHFMVRFYDSPETYLTKLNNMKNKWQGLEIDV